MITNRRKFLRIPTDEKCKARIDGVDLECSLVDQSINGAKIAGLDFLVVPYGKAIKIRHENVSFEAIIRGVTRGEDQQLLVGIERVEGAIKDEQIPEAMLLNCYLRHEGNLMVCVPIAMQADKRVRIQLWDGMQFPIAYSALVTMSRHERYQSLIKDSDVTTISEMYGLDVKTRQQLMVDAIFDFEFGVIENCTVKSTYSETVRS